MWSATVLRWGTAYLLFIIFVVCYDNVFHIINCKKSHIESMSIIFTCTLIERGSYNRDGSNKAGEFSASESRELKWVLELHCSLIRVQSGCFPAHSVTSVCTTLAHLIFLRARLFAPGFNNKHGLDPQIVQKWSMYVFALQICHKFCWRRPWFMEDHLVCSGCRKPPLLFTLHDCH